MRNCLVSGLRPLHRAYATTWTTGHVGRPLPEMPRPSFVVGERGIGPSPTSELLTASDVTVSEKLDALGRLTSPPVMLYHTSAHITLMDFLVHQTTCLNGAAFTRNGTHARTIVGAKGIGKSTVLTQFVRVAEAAFPNVIAVYASYSEPHYDDLMVPVVKELVKRGVMDVDWAGRVPDNELVALVLGALRQSGKRLLLVVDEMDQLYRVDYAQNPDIAKAAYKTLGRLAALGDRGGEFTSVLLCGSSTVLPLLITANGSRDAGIRSEYPRVFGAPNLNGTKFPEFRLMGGLPNDLATAKIVCGSGLPDAASDGKARLALFVAGSAPRYLLKAWTNRFSANLAAADAAMSTQSLSGPTKGLYVEIIRELRRVNDSWMRAMVDTDGRVKPSVVAWYHWEDKVIPLNWEQLSSVWSRVRDPASTEPLETQLQSELLRLCDKNFIASDLSDTSSGAPNSIYPQSVSQLFFSDGVVMTRCKLIGAYNLDLAAFLNEEARE